MTNLTERLAPWPVDVPGVGTFEVEDARSPLSDAVIRFRFKDGENYRVNGVEYNGANWRTIDRYQYGLWMPHRPHRAGGWGEEMTDAAKARLEAVLIPEAAKLGELTREDAVHAATVQAKENALHLVGYGGGRGIDRAIDDAVESAGLGFSRRGQRDGKYDGLSLVEYKRIKRAALAAVSEWIQAELEQVAD